MNIMSIYTTIIIVFTALFIIGCTNSNKLSGLTYHVDGGEKYTIEKSCADTISGLNQDNNLAIKVALKPGICAHEFKMFMSSHKGEKFTTSFKGKRLKGPTRIIAEMSPNFIQPVSSKEQYKDIIKFYNC